MVRKSAFVIMPFSDPQNSYYEPIFKSALSEAGFDVHRVDEIYAPRPIIKDIQDSIANADLILCELTGRNPNVLYELGLAHAIGRPVILVSTRQEDIPFDLRYIRFILYDTARAGWEDKLRRDVRLAAQSIATEGYEHWPLPLVRTTFPQGLLQLHPDGRLPGWEHLNMATTVAVLGISLRGILEVKSFLKAALLRGAVVRLLILSPDSPFIREREKQEGLNMRKGQIKTEAKSTLDRARELCEEVLKATLSPGRAPTCFSVRTYNTMPYCSAVITDKLVRYMPYLIHDRAGFTPAFDFDPNSVAAQHIIRHFEQLWTKQDTNAFIDEVL